MSAATLTLESAFSRAMAATRPEELYRTAYLDWLAAEGVWDAVEERIGDDAELHTRGDHSLFAGPGLRCATRLFRQHPGAMFVIYSDRPATACGFRPVPSSPILYYRTAARGPRPRPASVQFVEPT